MVGTRNVYIWVHVLVFLVAFISLVEASQKLTSLLACTVASPLRVKKLPCLLSLTLFPSSIADSEWVLLLGLIVVWYDAGCLGCAFRILSPCLCLPMRRELFHVIVVGVKDRPSFLLCVGRYKGSHGPM